MNVLEVIEENNFMIVSYFMINIVRFIEEKEVFDIFFYFFVLVFGLRN